MKRILVTLSVLATLGMAPAATGQCFVTSCWLSLNGHSHASMDAFLALHSVVGKVAYFDEIGVARGTTGLAVTNWDNNLNQYADEWEFRVLEYVLNTASNPDNAVLHQVWATNRDAIYQIINTNTSLSPTSKERVSLLFALYLTLGDEDSIEYIKSSLSSLSAAQLAFTAALGANAFDLRGIGIVGSSGDMNIYPDTDRGGTSNLIEALNIRYSIGCIGNRTKAAFLAAVFNPQDNGKCSGGGESADADGDGLLDSDEILAGTNPNDADSDNDGLNDGAEVHTHGTSPLVADTDGDSISDFAEINAGTNPLSDDTDDDGFLDDEDAFPRDPDTDRDYLADGREAQYGAVVGESDTDLDGIPDGIEVNFGYDPNDDSSIPDLPLNAAPLAVLAVAIAVFACARVRRGSAAR